MTTCRVTPDCRAPAIARVSTVHNPRGNPTLMAVRPISEQRIGYASCADHMHHVIDVRLHRAMPAPSTEDLQR